MSVPADVPAGVVQDQDDELALAGPDLLGERGQHRAEQLGVHPGADEPDHLAGARVDEAVEVEPLVAVPPDRDRPPAPRRPPPAQDRLQAEPVLVERPHLDRPSRVPPAALAHLRGELFLYAACSSGLAALACRGLGTCGLWPSFLR